MMVTACNDDQAAICAKAPALSPLLVTLGEKGGPLKEKVRSYMTLSERLKSDKDATLSCEIRQQTAQLTCIVSVDIMSDDSELNQAALQALGFCLHLPDISRAFSPDDASTIVKALCNALLKTKDKSTCTRALWCLSKQTFPADIIKTDLHTVLCALEHALVQGEFQSMTVEYEALNVIIRLLECLPDDMPTHSARWGKLLLPYVVRSAPKIRERAAIAMHLGLPAMLLHQGEIVPGLVADLKTTLVPEMMKLFASKCELHVLKVWGNYVTLLGKALHKGGGLINCLLGVVEQGFKHPSSDVKLASFVSWKVLIDNFAVEPDVLYNAKRLKLLLQPLRATNAKQELVAQAKLDTWWYLVVKLGPKAAMNFDQVCAPLLEFALGLNTNVNGIQCPSTPLAANGSGMRPGFSTPLHRMGPLFTMTSPATPRLSLPPSTPGRTAPSVVFKSIQLQGVEMLARVLGAPGDAVGAAPKYTFTINALHQPMILSSTAFIKFSSTLVPMVRDVICNLGDQLDEGLLFHLWYSLVIHVSDMVTTATKKDSVEVLTQFLTSLQCIVGAGILGAKTLLKFLEAVSHLPKTVLGSPSYHTSNAGLMHGTPALFLIELLLSSSLLETTAEERFFCVLETLIDCGLTVPGTVLRFSGSVLQLVDKMAADLHDGSVTWRIWSSIVYPLLGHIIETNEVNQGDSLDHDFSTMYASLLSPVQHLLPSGTLPQMTTKTLLKTWSELYQAFARCTAVVTTANANLGCEELCTKILASLQKQSMNLSYVDSLAQILQVIADNLDFSSFTLDAALNNPIITPGRGIRGRVRPLGNLTAFVRLLVRVIEEIKNHAKTESSKFTGLLLQSSNSGALSASIGTTAGILSTLFTNVSNPKIIESLLDKLADAVSCFYDNAGPFKSTSFPGPTWQKLEKLWMDLLTSVQTRHGGPYDSELLAAIAPLLESGLTHPKRAVKSHTMVFWNATFATVDSLDYPESLKVCLAKLKEKTTLVLPGWTDTEQQVVNETPLSQIAESETSQSLIPPPCIPAIPNFGGPSPQKMHGSFLRRAAQAERLYASSSPERYKNPSPFGRAKKESSVSPGKGLLKGLSSPPGGKGKRDGSPVVGGGAAARRRLHVDEESMGEFVFIAPSPKKTQVLTDHQKEMMRTRRVLPALYNDLEQSQDTQNFAALMSKTDATQNSPQVQMDGGSVTATSDESPSVFGLLNDQTPASKETSPNNGGEAQAGTVEQSPPSGGGHDELNSSKTDSEEPKKTAAEGVEKTDRTLDDDKDAEGDIFTFAGILSRIKHSEEEPSAPPLEVASAGEEGEKETQSSPVKTIDPDSSANTFSEKTSCRDEAAAKEAVLSPVPSKESLPTSAESGVASEENQEKWDDIVDKSLENDEMDTEEAEVEMEDVESGKGELKILAKDSTDEEGGEVEKDISASESIEDAFVPETQQSQSAQVEDVGTDSDLMVSPERVANRSKLAELKLNLTPVIKLQKLNDADLIRLSPDQSQCSFARLDINSSPKVFTSSEEESTPNRFAARLRRFHPQETLNGVRNRNSLKRSESEPVVQTSTSERVIPKKSFRGRSQRNGRNNLQSSQADLAELAEKFELDGVEPLADETDMDQSMDQLETDSQSKQTSSDEKTFQGIGEDDNGDAKKSKGRQKARGKKKSDSSAKQNSSINSTLSDSYAGDVSTLEDTTNEKLKTDQGSQDSQVSLDGENVNVKVPKKRGRKRKAKSTSLSPVAESSSPLPATEKTHPGNDDGQSQRSTRSSRKRSGESVPKRKAQEKDTLPSKPAPSKDTIDEPSGCAMESEDTEKESANPSGSAENSQAGSTSGLPDSQDEDQLLNSCDDLFESCPKDGNEESPSNIIKRSRRIGKSKQAPGKRKSCVYDCDEDSEEDNVPLAKIKHCYLDVDSQNSDSEVDFPKKRLQDSQTKENLKVVQTKDDVQPKTTETERLPNVKTRQSGKRLSVKSPKLSPKTSPKAAFARRILKRAKKSPHKSVGIKKLSPAQVSPKRKIVAKVSPVATRLRTSKHLSSLSVSVPSKLNRKPKRTSRPNLEKDLHCKPTKKPTFEEKLEKAVLQDIGDLVIPDDSEDLWHDLSPVAGLSTSLPIPDSKSLLSPSPVSFIEGDIHEKDIGFADEETAVPTEMPPRPTEQDANLDDPSPKAIELIIHPEAAESDEILSSSLVDSETVEDPSEEAMECSSLPHPESTEQKTAEGTDQDQDSASESASRDACPVIAEAPAALPQSPVMPMKFAPSCHSSPNVSGAARIQLANQGSPTGSIPAMYSPSGSPSGGILKRKDAASPSPNNKSRRVSFAEPISEQSPVKQFAVDLIPPATADDRRSKTHRPAHPPSPLVTTTSSKVISVHSKYVTTPSRRSADGFGAKSRVSHSGRRISPGEGRKRSAKQQGFAAPSSGHKVKSSKQGSQDTQGTPLTQGTQQNSLDSSMDEDYDNQESVFPDLAECGTPVERVLPQLTSSMWSRGLGQLVRARNILTVGHLCSLSPSEIRSLPIRSPKIGNLRRVMANFQRQQSGKGGTPTTTNKRKEDGMQAPARTTEGGGTDKRPGKDEESTEVGSDSKQVPDLAAAAVALVVAPTTETASTSKIEPPQPKQGTKRKREAHNREPETSEEEGHQSKPKQVKVVDRLEELVGEFVTEKLAELPSDRLFLAHQHVNSMMESIIAALKVKVKSPSLSS